MLILRACCRSNRRPYPNSAPSKTTVLGVFSIYRDQLKKCLFFLGVIHFKTTRRQPNMVPISLSPRILILSSLGSVDWPRIGLFLAKYSDTPRSVYKLWVLSKAGAVLELPSQPKPRQDNSASTVYAEVGTNMWKNIDHCGTRTHDLMIMGLILYRLSHGCSWLHNT